MTIKEKFKQLVAQTDLSRKEYLFLREVVEKIDLTKMGDDFTDKEWETITDIGAKYIPSLEEFNALMAKLRKDVV